MEQLREANPAATPDLTLANLSGADISSARLEMIKTGISVIMGNDEIRELAKQLADVSATVANLSGNCSQDQQTVSNALNKQHAAMKPLLHKTVRAIHKVLKSSPA